MATGIATQPLAVTGRPFAPSTLRHQADKIAAQLRVAFRGIVILRLSLPAVSRQQLVVAVWAFILVTLNAAFWSRGLAAFAGSPVAAAGFLGGVAALLLLGMLLLSQPYVTRALLAFLVLSAAIASHFMDTFGTIITTDIVVDSLATTQNESRSLITAGFLTRIGLFGLLPALLILLYPMKPDTLRQRLGRAALFGGVPVTIGLVATFANYAVVSSTIREHREAIRMFNPVSPLVSVYKGVRQTYFTHLAVVEAIGTDARKEPWLAAGSKPNLVVLVIGETARASDFSLFGYARNTNPELSKRDDLILFPNASSCGTLTADSVPCMFSDLGRAGFSRDAAAERQNLLHVLRHAGFAPRWFDANGGSKGVATDFQEISLANAPDPQNCRDNECHDGVLVEALRKALPGIDRDEVIVLHTIGSHGPAYSMRYPEAFKPFPDDCRSSDFKTCTREQIVNAYDNSIAYTDHTLGEVIRLLESSDDRLTSAMIYVSDHGESLGEYGVYLHGLPRIIAPEQQTHVPFIAWLSPSYRERRGVDLGCLKAQGAAEVSHDNFFHSALALAGVTTSARDASLDVFARCWSKGGASIAHVLQEADSR
jgi:lipid A ethanolaminephosphotransferase